jgi:hypothetical protein
MRLPVYDPQDLVGNTIAEVLRQEPFRLCPISVDGGGVYVLYYAGDHALYRTIRSPDATVPIYVGSTQHMARRLATHCRTIDDAWNLDRGDFLCRVLMLPPTWELPVEAKLIERFNPWWNRPDFQGFGNNNSRRVGGKASSWDVAHPGRAGALRLERTPEAVAAMAVERDAPGSNPVFDLFGSRDG